MTIENLTLSYPDFQAGAVINPEEFDQNNNEIVTKINEITSIVNEIDDKYATKTEVAGIILGQIPDGSLTDDKLSNEQGQVKDLLNNGFIADFASIRNSIDIINYNIYQLYLENYYDNKHTIKKGLFFDGFASTDVIDLVNSNVLFDLINKRICTADDAYIANDRTSGLGSQLVYDASCVKLGQTFTVTTEFILKSVVFKIRKIGSPSNGIVCKIYNVSEEGLPATEIATSPTIISSSVIDTVNYTDCTFAFDIILSPGVYALVIGTESENHSSSNYYNLASDTTGADVFADGMFFTYSSHIRAWSELLGKDLFFAIKGTSPEQNLVYQSKEQTLTQEFDNAVLYVKSKTTAGCSISAQMSIHEDTETFEDMTLVDTVDLGDGYQEDKFTYTSITPGTKSKIRITLNRPDTDTAFEADCYGCILGVG